MLTDVIDALILSCIKNDVIQYRNLMRELRRLGVDDATAAVMIKARMNELKELINNNEQRR